MPAGAIYVGRPTHWGNPFVVASTTPRDWPEPWAGIDVRDRGHALDLLRSFLAWRAVEDPRECGPVTPGFPDQSRIRHLLRGRDLACWCPLDQPCHADLLLEIANPRKELST